ncbi:MAG: hypothetical protein WBA13_08765 [Microcoleaceae cyanobacterium]
MVIQTFNTEDYEITYDTDTTTVYLGGSLRLSGLEQSNPIIQVLNEALDAEPQTITLNLRQLQFLNSFGINVLSKFVIKLRKKQTKNLVILASRQFPWQGKSLKNLQKLMPTIQLELD